MSFASTDVTATRRWVLALAIGVAAIAAAASAVPASAQQASLPEAAIEAIAADVAERAGVDSTDVEIVRVEEVTWANGCLGVEASGEACAQVLTDGFVAWAQPEDLAYRYHVDLTGANVRFAAGDIPAADVPTAALPQGATPREDGDGGTDGALISGDIPAAGGIGLLVVTQVTTVDAVLAELSSGGCEATTLAITSGGSWSVYVNGAPPAVNAGFGSDFEATTPFFVRCA